MAEQLEAITLRDISRLSFTFNLLLATRKKGSEAEIDYIIQHENQIIPIEVKAGTTGTLKSLIQFMKEKKCIKSFNSDIPRRGPVHVKNNTGTFIGSSITPILSNRTTASAY